MSFAAQSDASLLDLIQSGDEQAMAAFYDRHCALVYTVALNMLRDRAGAEDITHEIFMQVWRSTPQFIDSPRAPRRALAVSTWRHSSRRRKDQPAPSRLDIQF